MKQSFFISISILLFTLPSCKTPPEKTQPTVEKISESVYASGIIKSKGQYQVFSTVGGLIQKMLVAEGDVVNKGDALFIVQNDASKLNTENAQLAADFAAANVKGERLTELKTNIETARSKMVNDSISLVRQRGLWAQQIGSKVELEQRELAYTSSLNAYKAALSRYKDLERQLGFAAEQSKKQLSVSQSLAGDYVVRSQTYGRVYGISKEAGEMVGPQTPVAVIGSAEEFVAELQIDENDIVRVKKGQLVLLVFDSYKGQVFEAEISKIDPLMNERSRTFTVEAEFTKKPPTLFPNMTTEANIIIQSKEKALTIPRNYLVGDTAVIMENMESRRVQLGLKDYVKAEVVSGLKEGEVILKSEE